MKFDIKKDKYSRFRGGNSVILDIKCALCKTHIFFYQKDGPGPLKRMYLDRIYDEKDFPDKLKCPNCSEVLASKIIYKKEDRLAYKVFVGALFKSKVK